MSGKVRAAAELPLSDLREVGIVIERLAESAKSHPDKSLTLASVKFAVSFIKMSGLCRSVDDILKISEWRSL